MKPAAVEAKVKTSTLAAAVTGLVLAGITALLGQEPSPVWVEIVTMVVFAVVPGVVTFTAGWLTRHTPRELLTLEVDDTPEPNP